MHLEMSSRCTLHSFDDALLSGAENILGRKVEQERQKTTLRTVVTER